MKLIVSFIKMVFHSFKTLGLLTQRMMNGGQLSLVNENLISRDQNFRRKFRTEGRKHPFISYPYITATY